MQERVAGKTPHGGDYTIAVFLDDEGNEVDKEVATRAVISECKDDGTVVFEEFGEIRHTDVKLNYKCPENPPGSGNIRCNIDEGEDESPDQSPDNSYKRIDDEFKSNYTSKFYGLMRDPHINEGLMLYDEDSSGINRYLSDPEDMKYEFDDDQLKEIRRAVKGIDKALSSESSIVDRDIKVYRGLDGSVVSDLMEATGGKIFTPGEVFKSKSYTSVSGNPKVAVWFSKHPDDSKSKPDDIYSRGVKNLVEIRVPKGTSALYLGDMYLKNNPRSDAATLIKDKNYEEFVLPRNTKFKVVDVREARDWNHGDIRITTWEVIPNKPKQKQNYKCPENPPGMKDALQTIKSEQSTGKVSKESYQALKDAVHSAKDSAGVPLVPIERKPFDTSTLPSDPNEITDEHIQSQATASDIYAQMDSNLESIKSKSEPHFMKVSGKMNRENRRAIVENAKTESRRYEHYLSGDTTNLIRDHIDSMGDLLRDKAFKNIDAADMDNLMRDSVQKLMHQEVEAAKKTFSDHGIRHVVGNIKRQNMILDAVGYESPRDRLMAAVIMINHDVGYTAPLVRSEDNAMSVKTSSKHPEMSGKIMEEQRDIWDRGKIFSEKEYDKIVDTIKTHDSTKIDMDDMLATSTRISDNLAIFATDKLPSVFRYVDGAQDILVDMGVASREKDEKKFNGLRDDLHSRIDKTEGISTNMKRDLKAATNTITAVTPKFTLGTMAGEINRISYRGDKIDVLVDYNEFDEVMQSVFDMGQRQTKKFLEDYGVTDYGRDEYEIGDFMTLRIRRPKQKQNSHLDKLVLPIEHEVINEGNLILQSVLSEVIDELSDAGFFDGVEEEEEEEEV